MGVAREAIVAEDAVAVRACVIELKEDGLVGPTNDFALLAFSNICEGRLDCAESVSD